MYVNFLIFNFRNVVDYIIKIQNNEYTVDKKNTNKF